MLNMQQQQQIDPLSDFLDEGVAQVVIYQKRIQQNYKSRAKKNRERIEKLTKYATDPVLKKQRRMQQKQQEKAKLQQALKCMSKQEARVYLDGLKKERADLKLKVRSAMKDGQIIMLDLAYEDKMNEKENKSLSKQIQLIMRAIKHAQHPPSIHLCSLAGHLHQQLQKMKYQFWALTSHHQNVVQVGAKLGKKLVYLSPDADIELQSIDKDTCYILGGLIDRTIIKNASLNRARQLGIEARRLPISEFMKGRLCLNLDHVVSMIYKFTQTASWKQAFEYAAPKRWKKQHQSGSQREEEDQKSSYTEKEGQKGKNQREKQFKEDNTVSESYFQAQQQEKEVESFQGTKTLKKGLVKEQKLQQAWKQQAD